MIFDANAFQAKMLGNYKKQPVTGVTPVTGCSVTGAKSLKLLRLPVLLVEEHVIPNVVNKPVTEPVTDQCQILADASHYVAALAKLERDEQIPAAFKIPWARFQSTSWPDIDLNRRDELIADAGLFLDAWAKDADGSDWSASDLFDRPSGLIWRLKGRKVAALGWRCFRLDGDAKLSEFGEGAADD